VYGRVTGFTRPCPIYVELCRGSRRLGYLGRVSPESRGFLNPRDALEQQYQHAVEDRCKGGCSVGPLFDPVSIPHDIENRGVATRIDKERIRRSAPLSNDRRRSRNRPGSTSQGGDTGSNPVGTTRGHA
jgi:hypothetical protein